MRPIDREKVIKGLECCAHIVPRCLECPLKEQKRTFYSGKGCDCRSLLADNALTLLKAQEPRVMTWEEAQVNVQDGPFIIMELRDSTGTEIDYGVLVGDSYEMSEGSLLTVCEFGLLKDYYGKSFRLWTSRPTDEQRKAVKWNE